MYVLFLNRTLIDNSAFGTEKVLACINISIIIIIIIIITVSYKRNECKMKKTLVDLELKEQYQIRHVIGTFDMI